MDQKSVQRPPISQSPYRVGSGPFGPPISRGRDWVSSTFRGALGVTGTSGMDPYFSPFIWKIWQYRPALPSWAVDAALTRDPPDFERG
jgi:hypothetical protein